MAELRQHLGGIEMLARRARRDGSRYAPTCWASWKAGARAAEVRAQMEAGRCCVSLTTFAPDTAGGTARSQAAAAVAGSGSGPWLKQPSFLRKHYEGRGLFYFACVLDRRMHD